MLRNFDDIIEVIKDIISLDCGDRRIMDKDVAEALKIKHATFGTIKKRKSIPFKQICNFASKKKLDLNYILTIDTKRICHA
ncbi:helix-turn-helix domain-containing protein [Sulfurimonas sp.]|uniref:helix-turn-helix domain-containing protein n=1 Tax=Sulfurimonas sp. TaxID=2022749 RepID=UPI0025F96511|nr:helix-turn-helix domain-containing protein [Sulfurimonas sp.]